MKNKEELKKEIEKNLMNLLMIAKKLLNEGRTPEQILEIAGYKLPDKIKNQIKKMKNKTEKEAKEFTKKYRYYLKNTNYYC